MAEAGPHETIFEFSTENLLPEATLYLKSLQAMCERLRQVDFGDTVFTYCPLDYAFEMHRNYTEQFCNTQKRVLFLGMNPGPHGMAQTGVPFGAVEPVKQWLQIDGQIYPPEGQHPQRPIIGLESRNEVSGMRFWGLFEEICKTPANFFRNCFVYNYCPLTFLTHSGSNLTPDKMDANGREKLTEACDECLMNIVRILNIKTIVAVGRFVERCAKNALRNAGINHVNVRYIYHPSPRSPIANQGWRDKVKDQLDEMGVMQYLAP